jgi:hypothetical protein
VLTRAVREREKQIAALLSSERAGAAAVAIGA